MVWRRDFWAADMALSKKPIRSWHIGFGGNRSKRARRRLWKSPQQAFLHCIIKCCVATKWESSAEIWGERADKIAGHKTTRSGR